MQYYFLKTLKIDGREKMRPLKGQTFPDGEPVREDYNCGNAAGDKVIRTSYPLGTVFVATSLELRESSGKNFYTTSGGNIYPVGIAIGDYLDDSHRPSEAMVNAYNEFKSSHKESMGDLFREEENRKKAELARMSSSFLSDLRKDPRYACPTIEKDGYYVTEKDWFFILANMLKGQPLLLTGPTGAGKTELLRLTCKKTGIPFRKYDMGGIHDPMEQMLGTQRLEEGVSVFDYSQFAVDVQGPGVILLDELSRAPRETYNILFPLLDSSRTLRVDMAGSKDIREIKIHPDCVFMATANIGDEYTGTTQIDKALKDRFVMMELGYLPDNIEAKLISSREDISIENAKSIVDVAKSVRELKESKSLLGDDNISTRETLRAARLVNWGYSALEAMERVFLPLFDGTDKEGDRAVVRTLFATR